MTHGPSDITRARTARLMWAKDGGDETTHHPDPEVRARIAEPHEIPATARRLADYARGLGWSVVETYARGTRPGRAPRVVDSLALRMTCGALRAVAIWQDARFETAVRWDADGIASCNQGELREWLAYP